MSWRSMRPLVAGALVLLGAGGAWAQRDTAIAAIASLERGQWVLKDADGGEQRICLTNPSALIQLNHASGVCQHIVMASDAKSATVRYVCQGHGQGRTTISVETPRLARIETQGVIDGAPFSKEYEGRRVGTCS